MIVLYERAKLHRSVTQERQAWVGRGQLQELPLGCSDLVGQGLSLFPRVIDKEDQGRMYVGIIVDALDKHYLWGRTRSVLDCRRER